ncbi:MAG TPA: hypothetical protein VKH44_09025 [Pirellulaceae bacterium]|nr:hypothetical protein [Pirellulaceae bacterium]
MIAMLLVLLVTVGNFALGFGLAVHFGHGPTELELPTLNQIRDGLRSLLRLNSKGQSSSR